MALSPAHTFQILTKRPERMREYVTSRPRDSVYPSMAVISVDWPLPNVWLGVSVEDRQRKDRIDHLRETPAALRFLSLEPLLEDLGELDLSGIDWAIIGGESGPGARPCNVKWVRSIVRQCREAGVAPFVKQLGAYVTDRNDSPMNGEGLNPWPSRSDGVDTWFEDEFGYDGLQGDPCRVFLESRKGGNTSEWPADLRVREFPLLMEKAVEATR
jgi:protein gp37